jgi:hypothetical protein
MAYSCCCLVLRACSELQKIFLLNPSEKEFKQCSEPGFGWYTGHEESF